MRVPATTANLGPGFDVLGLALTLYNEVTVSTDASETAVQIRGESDASLPVGSDNYVVRGAQAVFAMHGRRTPPLNVEVESSIPISRGLGSSAGALVSGAVAAGALLENEVDPMQTVFSLTEIEGHAEQLAACLWGGLVAISPPDPLAPLGAPGRTPVAFSLPVADELHIALAIPDLRLETKRARAALPHEVPFGDAVANIGAVTALCQGLADGDAFLVRLGMRDRLHQEARSELNPASTDAMAAARDAGAWGACWSGAGPTILSVCDDPETAAGAASAMVDAFAAQKVSAQARTCTVDSDGCRVLEVDGEEVESEWLTGEESPDEG